MATQGKSVKRRSTSAPAPITAWSPSRVKTWEMCPAKLRFPLDGHREAKSEALNRGIQVHSEGEQYLNGMLAEVPESYRYFKEDLEEIRSLHAQPEINLSFTRKWETCDWMASDCWVRMRFDALIVNSSARVIDFKTGRPGRVSDEEQVDLYAVGIFQAWPTVPAVRGELWYLDTADVVEIEYQRNQTKHLCKTWEARAKPMLEDYDLPTKPGPYCRWCGFAASKGGPCQDEQK